MKVSQFIKAASVVALLGVAQASFAHVSVGIGIGLPVYSAPAYPVYAPPPPPVYYNTYYPNYYNYGYAYPSTTLYLGGWGGGGYYHGYHGGGYHGGEHYHH